MQPWDGIDWESLEHNYGSAADVPHLLQRCTSTDADDVAEAISELDNALHHQGGWICSASSAALPFLLDLAVASATHHRAAFVYLVWDHCRTWQTADEKWIDPAWPGAVRSVEPRVRAVVADHDPRVRRPAIHVAAGLLEPRAAETLLIGLWETELDQATRIDLIDALSVVLKRDPERVQARSVLEETAAGGDAQLSIAALLELPDATNRAARLVVAAQSLVDMDAKPWKEAAAYDVGVGGVLSAILNAVLPNQVHCLELLKTFLTPEAGEVVPDELAQRALEGCGRLLSRRRDAADKVAPLIVPYLASPDPGVRYTACYLLACTGNAAQPYADEIALLLQDQAVDEARHARRVVAAAAMWAMARIGDPRCLPYVRDELEGRTNLFSAIKSSLGGSYFTVWEISIDDLMRPLHAYADALQTDVLRAMARNERPHLTQRLAEVLQDWDIRGKVPAGVVDLLKSDEKWRQAALTIGSLGEVVFGQHRRAARLLARRAKQDDGLAAWAYRRLTRRDVFGDQTLSRVLDAAITTRHDTVSLSERVLPYIATRPPATRSDAARLRKLLDGNNAVRLTAAAALYLLHGGTEQGDALVRNARQNHWGWRILAIVLNEVRDVPAAQETFGPIARELIEDRNRVGTDVGWAVIARDESLTARASRFLA
ncbi:hypothetical protein ACQEVI_23360 [Promicromonospora sp. CA-289599]|uniref:hypothetical protein n=1 Tax=Promicromonospora sp. CA-289599 TaxID=3240014 RepID=UPI003D914B07